jgi:hypothetical protein
MAHAAVAKEEVEAVGGPEVLAVNAEVLADKGVELGATEPVAEPRAERFT